MDSDVGKEEEIADATEVLYIFLAAFTRNIT